MPENTHHFTMLPTNVGGRSILHSGVTHGKGPPLRPACAERARWRVRGGSWTNWAWRPRNKTKIQDENEVAENRQEIERTERCRAAGSQKNDMTVSMALEISLTALAALGEMRRISGVAIFATSVVALTAPRAFFRKSLIAATCVGFSMMAG